MPRTRQKTCYIRTFGCQMNEHDSAKMRLILAKNGYISTDEPKEADIMIFNTCSIREKAYHKAISEIGRSHAFKKQRPDMKIGVMGCVAQQEGVGLANRFEHVDFVFGTDHLSELEDIDEMGGRLNAVDCINRGYEFPLDVPAKVESGHAFVTIIKGCNSRCAFCIVPSVRGKETSRGPHEIISEIKSLVKSGAREATLLGQNVTAYKFKDLKLAGLIRKISEETDIARVRFMSPHPKDVDDDLINEFGSNPKLAPHIHLPIQSGSNVMLKTMRRGYTKEKYLELIAKVRAARKGISVTSDFIAGFPSERDADFDETMDIISRVRFDSIFAFKYSPRPNTWASAKLKDDVPQNVKEERLNRLLAFQRKITLEKNASLVGTTHDVLVTGLDRRKSGLIMGRLPDNRIVNFAGNKELIGTIVGVKMTYALANSMRGEIINGRKLD